MKNLSRRTFSGWVAVGVLCFAVEVRAEHTRVTNPTVLGFEVLGRCLMYSAVFDHVLNDDLAAGLGIGSTSTQTLSGIDANRNATALPVYLNYYFSRDQGSVFATVGATLVTNSGDVSGLKSAVGGLEYPSGAVLGTGGLGYENRGDNGFLFRLTAYAIAGKSVIPWVGFGFGYAF
jgi:hypothetical protein